MKRHIRPEQGSATLIAVTVFVLIALAVTGWLVWKKADTKEGKTTPANTAQNEKKQEGTKYLTIKEWGVKFALPEGLREDLTHYLSDTDASGTILFASQKLNKLAGDNTCDLVRQPDGSYSGGLQASLVRINPNTYPKDKLEPYRQNLNYIKTLGDYDYYSRKSGSATCATDNGMNSHPGLYDAEEDISHKLREAFVTLETTP